MLYLEEAETKELESGKEINALRLQQFAVLVGRGISSPSEAFREIFKPPPNESNRTIEALARSLFFNDGLARKIEEVKQSTIAGLEKRTLISRIECVSVLANRVLSDKTHSRDIPGLVNKLQELTGWDKEDDDSGEDPITKLLAELHGQQEMETK